MNPDFLLAQAKDLVKQLQHRYEHLQKEQQQILEELEKEFVQRQQVITEARKTLRDDADFDEFDLSRFGDNYGTQGEPAVYTTSSKGDASYYGRETKAFDVDVSNYEELNMIDSLKETYDNFESYQDVPFDEWVEGMDHEELINVLDFDNLIGNEARHAKKAGKKGIIADFSGTEGGDVILSFDPKNIKSLNPNN